MNQVMDVLSDEILLLVLRHLALHDLSAVSCVNKRLNRVLRDTSLYRNLNCSELYKLSQPLLQQFVTRSNGAVEHIILRDCYWLNSTVISNALKPCRCLVSLDLIGCNVTVKSLLSIVLNNSGLTSLGWTVPNADISSDLYTNPRKTETLTCSKLRESFIRLHSLSLQFDSVKQFEDIFPLFSSQMQLRELRLQCFRFGERISALSKAKPYYDITLQSSDAFPINISAIDQAQGPGRFQWNNLLDHRFLHFSLMFFDFIIKTIMDTAKTRQLHVLLAPGSTLCWKYVAYLCETTTLVKADISNASLGDSQIAWLLSLHSLTHLNLSKVTSTSPSLKNVTSVLSNLVMLNLFSSEGCIDEEFENLKTLAVSCPNLKQLNLGNIHCHGSKGIMNIYSSLSLMKNLESLNLAACHQCDDPEDTSGALTADMKTRWLKRIYDLCTPSNPKSQPSTPSERALNKAVNPRGLHFMNRSQETKTVGESSDSELLYPTDVDSSGKENPSWVCKKLRLNSKDDRTTKTSESPWLPCSCPGTSSGTKNCSCRQSSSTGNIQSGSNVSSAPEIGPVVSAVMPELGSVIPEIVAVIPEDNSVTPDVSSVKFEVSSMTSESSSVRPPRMVTQRISHGSKSFTPLGKRHSHCLDKKCRRCYCCEGKFLQEQGYREMTLSCTKITEFELVAIDMETFPHRLAAHIKPTKCSLDFSETCLSSIANWTHLQKLTLGGFHTTGSLDYLISITRQCQQLKELSLIHLRSLHHSTSVMLLNKALMNCANLTVFRLEQSHFNITDVFLKSFHNCKKLHSLCIICMNGKPMTGPPLLELFSKCKYLIALQILCSIPKVTAKKMQSAINQRFLKSRPALAVTIEPYTYASEDGLKSVPSVHLRNLTFFDTKVATQFT